jgi:hypothetical protein
MRKTNRLAAFKRKGKVMRKFSFLGVFILLNCILIFGQTAPRSYYVIANGDDNNNGRSEEAAFKTLKKAVDMASKGAVKTITVLGILNEESEGRNGNAGLFIIENTGATEILITGKVNTTETERAILSGIGNYYGTVVYIESASIKFENIEISGGRSYDGAGHGGGLSLSSGAVTLGNGAKICNNIADEGGGGVQVRGGVFTLDGGDIVDNKVDRGYGNLDLDGGGVLGDVIIISGRISNNSAKGSGGGVCGFVTMKGGTISDNVSNIAGGGIYGYITMTDGIIRGNKSNRGGGIYIRESESSLLSNGTIEDNTATDGGGIYIEKGSTTFTMSGGLVKSNSAKNGGGIYVGGSEYQFMGQYTYGTLIIQNGSINSNRAEYGAGVYVTGVFNLNNGKIESNEAEFVGGGVYIANGSKYTKKSGVVSDNNAGDGEGENEFKQ